MSSGVLFWLSVVIVGATLGALFRPRNIAIVFGCLAGMGILGLVLSGIAGSDAVWYFGIGLMAGLPASAIALFVATVMHSVTRRPIPKHNTAQELDNAADNIRAAVDEALKQFRAGKPVTVECPQCQKNLNVSYEKFVNQLFVTCPCNRCRGDFPKQGSDGTSS